MDYPQTNNRRDVATDDLANAGDAQEAGGIISRREHPFTKIGTKTLVVNYAALGTVKYGAEEQDLYAEAGYRDFSGASPPSQAPHLSACNGGLPAHAAYGRRPGDHL
ncbi:hypothetical protein DSO57_1035915 [Entomophthora muscae]|uniref:Uncharacterized protein n=1 Tax=Entomophthora muscae TaxID=34485 RepID=A0ACC2TM65_9FUNG|nr:hypothetical protein DSO57_1035915 [Entomophthora muscae]